MSRTSIRTDYRSGDDDDASKKKDHPYAAVFNQKVIHRLEQDNHAMAKLTLSEFEDIKWPNEFPSIICDVIEQLTEMSIEQIVRFRRVKEAEDAFKRRFVDEARQEREKDPSSKITDKDLMEKYMRENRSKDDVELEDFIVRITETQFKPLWRFFCALSKNGSIQSHKTKVFLTQGSVKKGLS